MAAPCVEVNIATKDGKSSKFSESVTDMTGNITLSVLHQVLKKMQLEVNSSLTILVETAKKKDSRPNATVMTGVGDHADISDNDIDELDEDSEEDEEDERRPEKRKSNEELESQKVAKVT